MSKTTEYSGDMIYENGSLKRILVDGGYIENGVYHFYVTGHLGNNYMVVNASGTIVQKNQYYPFGMSFADDVSPSAQPYKYNGKEQDQMHGLNQYDYSARNYDPVMGRFTTMDPLAEKYFSISPYAYCLNNPIKLVDPDGRDAVIAIYGNQITVSANVYLYGAGATNAVRSQYQSDVNAKWGGTYSATSANGTSFDVSVNVNFSLYGGKEKNNPTIIPESWNPFNRDNFVEVGAGDKRSYVQGGDEGVWRSQGRNGMTLAQDNPAPHEVGHLLGLGDRYTDKGGVNKGWEGNIMGESRTGNVEQRNIDGILKDAMKAYDKWIQNPKNEGKEFRYEINTNNPNY